MAATNSSYSKTYLTRRNYRGQRLLRTIRDSPQATGTTDESSSLSRTDSKMAKPTEEDVMALPLSSDDEERSQKSRSSSPPRLKRKVDEAEISSPPTKRAKNRSKATRSSMEPAKEPEPPASSQPTISVPDFPDFMSQSSQTRKAKTYGRMNTTQSSSQGSKFADPGDAPATPKKSQSRPFTAPEEVPNSRKRTPKKRLKDVDIVPFVSNSPRKSAAFRMPDETAIPISSSISTELSHTSDLDNDVAPNKAQRTRSSSTSSLSSLDSLASHELSQKQKGDLLLDPASIESLKPVPEGSTRCPLCQIIVSLANKPSQPDPSTLSLRLQQQFCHTHRVHDAHVEWTKKNYPKIDWTSLETKRIPSHIPHLGQILFRETPSYYLKHLEHKLEEARGNRSKIRKYLAQDIVEVVQTGYYGPRGAKIMGDKITVELTTQLRRSLKTDKVVRNVGVSGYVSAVLIPEMLQSLVLEDMGLDGEDEARRVVAESSDVGMLVWPDDDHVDLDDADVDIVDDDDVGRNIGRDTRSRE